MNLTDYMTEYRMLPRLDCRDKREIVARMVEALSVEGSVSSAAGLAADILRREDEEPTALGLGLALPHARSAKIDGIAVVVATLAEPLDMGAADGRPVDVVILSVGPLEDPRGMLRVLAKLARVVKQRGFLDSLRLAAGPQQMLMTVERAESNI